MTNASAVSRALRQAGIMTVENVGRREGVRVRRPGWPGGPVSVTPSFDTQSDRRAAAANVAEVLRAAGYTVTESDDGERLRVQR